MSLISLLVAVVIFALVFWAWRMISGALGVPAAIVTVVNVILVVVFVIWVLQALLGVLGGPALRL